MASLEQTKTYGVSYTLTGDAGKLETALQGAIGKVELLEQAFARAREHMQTIFGNKNMSTMFDSLVAGQEKAIKSAKAATQKAIREEKKALDQATTVKVTGTLAGQETKDNIQNQLKTFNPPVSVIPVFVPDGMTRLQKTLDNWKLKVLVTPKLTNGQLLQEELNAKTYTINVKANVTGVKEAKPGTASGVMSTSAKKTSSFSVGGINRAPINAFSTGMQQMVQFNNALHAASIADLAFKKVQNRWLAATEEAKSASMAASQAAKTMLPTDPQLKALEDKAEKSQAKADKLLNRTYNNLLRRSQKANAKLDSTPMVRPYLMSADWFARDVNGNPITPMPQQRSGTSPSSSKKQYSSPTAQASASPIAQLRQSMTALQNYVKSNPLIANIAVSYGQSRTQVSRILQNLRDYALTRPIKVPVEVVWGNAGGQLQNILSGLQNFAGKGITAPVTSQSSGAAPIITSDKSDVIGSKSQVLQMTDDSKKAAATTKSSGSKPAMGQGDRMFNQYMANQKSMFPIFEAVMGRQAASELMSKLNQKFMSRAHSYNSYEGGQADVARAATEVNNIMSRIFRGVEQQHKRQMGSAAKIDAKAAGATPFEKAKAQEASRAAAVDESNKNQKAREKAEQKARKQSADSYMKDLQARQKAMMESQKWAAAESKRREGERNKAQNAERAARKAHAESIMRDLTKQYKDEQAANKKAAIANEKRNAERIAHNQRVAERAMTPYGPAGGKNDIYTRLRKSWYPFTGNTSFGARTPMALDMAKGMGVMFAVSGLMQTVSSSFSQVAEYENIMKTVQAILQVNDKGGNFQGRFKAMENEIRRVGRTTKFTAPEVAGAAKFMSMAGLGISDITAATNPIANLALVGDNDLSTTADKMTNIMTSFGLLKGLSTNQKKMNMTHTSDVLTNTFTKSNTNLIQLAEAMQYAGPMSHLTGTSLEDAAAMVGVMGNAGIQSSMAGTTLRMMYQNIIKPNKKQAAEWDRLGIKRTDEQGRVRNIFDILQDLRAKITGTTDLNAKIGPDQLKIMGAEVMSLFRTTAGAGTAALLENLGEAIELARSNRTANGVAQTIADEKKNTIQGLWAQVTSTFTDQSVNTVTTFQATIKEMLKDMATWLASKEAGEALRSIYDLAREVLDVLTFVAKIWKNLYMMAPNVISTFLKFQMMATQIGFLVTPFIQVIGAISTFKTGLVSLATSLGIVASASKAAATANKAQAVSNMVGGGISYNTANTGLTASSLATGGRFRARFGSDYARMAAMSADPVTAAMYSNAANRANLIRERANRIYGSGRIGRSFSAGRAALSFANAGAFMTSLWGGIKSMLLGIGTTIAKVVGMILSPVGLVTAGIAALGTAAYLYYDHCKKAKEQAEALSEISKEMQKTFNALHGDVIRYASEKYGFKPIEIGYNPTKPNSDYSLEGDKQADKIFNSNDVTAKKIQESIAGTGYYDYLDPYIQQYFKNGGYDRKFAQKAALISKWQQIALQDESVKNAEKAIADARLVGNERKVLDIVNSFKTLADNTKKRMIFDGGSVEDIYKMTNPQNYKDFYAAQYQYLLNYAQTKQPTDYYREAMNNLEKLQGKKNLKEDNIQYLANRLLLSVPQVGKNGVVGSVIMDRNGKVDWRAMANKYNDGKEYNVAERYNIIKNIYDTMSRNEQLQKSPEILTLLRSYLPKLAGQKGMWIQPGDEVHAGDQFNPEDWREAVTEWHRRSGKYVGNNTAEQFFNGRGWRNVKNQNIISAWWRDQYYGSSSEDNKNNNITPPNIDQSAYDSKYNRHQARPTQIIFNIDQLCKFENTQVNSADQKSIAETVGRQLAEGLQVLFAQAASDFSIVGEANG